MASTADPAQSLTPPIRIQSFLPPATSSSDASLIPIDSSAAPTSLATALAFTDIGFKTLDGSKLLLNGVTGAVLPGTMMAVMGPSGAGKSTFLDVLSRRRLRGAFGKVFLGKQEIATPTQMATVASYVEQRDDLLGVLTVRESINYAAKLSMPTEPKAERLKRVEHVSTHLIPLSRNLTI
ncbi:hypothetical protein HDU67_010016 [Dinochytrium kinnereticum]|nr:hypothetical protein HDU67_010016 [Dinochytrium kinnereticum]